MTDIAENEPRRMPLWQSRLVVLALLMWLGKFTYDAYWLATLSDRHQPAAGSIPSTLPALLTLIPPSPPARVVARVDLPQAIWGEWQIAEEWSDLDILYRISSAPKRRHWTTKFVTIGATEIDFFKFPIHRQVPILASREVVVAGAANEHEVRFWRDWITPETSAVTQHSKLLFLERRVNEQAPNGVIEFHDGDLWLCLFRDPPAEGAAVPLVPTDRTEVYHLVRPVKRLEGYTETDIELSRRNAEAEIHEPPPGVVRHPIPLDWPRGVPYRFVPEVPSGNGADDSRGGTDASNQH